MEIAEVIDRETLRAFLIALPEKERRRVTLRVAFNAAARLLPVVVNTSFESHWNRVTELTPTGVFCAVASLGGAQTKVASELGNSAIKANIAAANAADACSIAAVSVVPFKDQYYATAAAAKAAAHATRAAHGSGLSPANVNSAVNAVDAACSACSSAWGIDLWDLVAVDLLKGNSLWPQGAPQIVVDCWTRAAFALEEHSANWAIWIHWYNRILQCRDWHAEAMGEVLQEIIRDDWEKGPEHINPMFDEVLELYLAEDAAQASAGAEPTIGTPSQIAQTKIAMETYRRELPSNFDAVLGFISLEMERLQNRNYRNDDDGEEAKRQISVLATLHETISDLAALVPKTSEMPEEDAVAAESLARLYVNKFKAWPRANADEMVDNSYRFALVGLTAVMLPMVGVSASVAAGCGAAFFAGERVLKSVKAAKDLLN